jgi:hypothetical protein
VSPVQVNIPFVQHGEERSERCVARRAPNGRTARLLTIPHHVQGVSIHDLVRFEPGRDGRPGLATELVARSPLLTLHLEGPTAHVAALRRRLAPVVVHPGTATELAPGHLAVAIAPHLFGVVLEHATASSPGAGRDDRQHRAGRWRWSITSRPTWPSPIDLPAAASELVAADELAVWSPDDAIGRDWDPRFVAELRHRAGLDRDIREGLRTQRYLVAVVPVLRDVLSRTYGPTRSHARTFPLGAADPDAARRAWEDAHDSAGRVRWAPDRHVDRDLRAMIVALGLDPAADPSLPTVGTSTSTARPRQDRAPAGRAAARPAPRRDLVGGGRA